MTNVKRSWSAVGKRSALCHKIGYINSYLFTAIAPMDGESFHLLGFSDATTETTNAFLDELQKNYPDTHNIIIWDNAPFHRPKILHEKENCTILFLPSYGQELNPVERYFGEMRKVTANKTFENIQQIEELLTTAILEWQKDTEAMKQLTCWDWFKKQVNTYL